MFYGGSKGNDVFLVNVLRCCKEYQNLEDDFLDEH